MVHEEHSALATPGAKKSGKAGHVTFGETEEREIELQEREFNSSDVEEEDEDGGFERSWNFFRKPSGPAPGSLRAHMYSGPTPGLSQPPQCYSVQKELMELFRSEERPAKVKRRPIKPRKNHSVAEVTPKPTQKLKQHTTLSRLNANRVDEEASPSTTSTSWTLPWAPDVPLPGAEARAAAAPAAGGNTRIAAAVGKAQISSAELWAQSKEEHTQRQAAAPSVSFLEVSRWSNDLATKSRFSNFALNERALEDVGELAIYHNGMARSATQLERRETAREAAREARSTSSSLGRVWATASAPTLGRCRRAVHEEVEEENNNTNNNKTMMNKTVPPSQGRGQNRGNRWLQQPQIGYLEEQTLYPGSSLLSPIGSSSSAFNFRNTGSRSEKQSWDESLDAVRMQSSSKLMEKAKAVLSAPPSRLQFLSEVAGVSTVTGATAHRDRLEWLLTSTSSA